MTKDELRNIYKQKRSLLTSAEKSKLEDLILIQFQQLNIEIPSEVMTYAPFEKYNEFDPQLITDYCYFKNPLQSLYYPMMDMADNSMVCVLVNDNTEFEINKMGIAEPVNGLLSSPEEIDMVIMPLLAFDETGHRVGYGKGYYDRFLKECREDIIKIGFSFFEAESQIKEVNKFDVKLDYCITPKNIYKF
ncbi:MAG: 5-formyltetrahydrofolate cyclo-ligase [Ferruginibacter sp.]